MQSVMLLKVAEKCQLSRKRVKSGGREARKKNHSCGSGFDKDEHRIPVKRICRLNAGG